MALDQGHEQSPYKTHLSCMDGKNVGPDIKALEEKYPGYLLDTVTAPGLNGLMSGVVTELPEIQGRRYNVEVGISNIEYCVRLSVYLHQSDGIIISAHRGCAGNPGKEREQHTADIRATVRMIRSWGDEYATIPIEAYYSTSNSQGQWIAEAIDLSEPEELLVFSEAQAQAEAA